MDFAKCPACQQSVLDDDAVDCPFCGASMKAKPGSVKPKPAAAAKPAASPPKPAVKSPGKPAPSDDSPFDLVEGLAEKATPASATRTKSRPLEVKCPMCETVGYVPNDAAGQSVKCANPKCLVPVFMAPRLEPVKQEEPPPPPKPKRNLFLVGGITAAVMIIGGTIAWMVAGLPTQTPMHVPTPEELELVRNLGKKSPVTAPTNGQQPVTPEGDDPAPPKVSPAEATETSFPKLLKTLNDAALQPRQNRSKPYCRRLSTEAFAIADDLAGAKLQLEALGNVGGDVPFYRTTPLVQIAWKQLAKGDRPGADKSLDDAVAAAGKLPKQGRDRLESVIALASILIAAQRDAEAQQFLEQHSTADRNGQWAAVSRAAHGLQSFDLAAASDRRLPLDWNAPLIAGVVYDLVGHQHTNSARAWIAKLKSPRDRAEGVAALIDAVCWEHTLSGSEIPFGPLLADAEGLPTPGNVLALSQLGIASQGAGATANAESCLTKALELVAAWEPVSEIALPEDLQELSKLKAPDSGAGEFRLAAATAVSQLAARLKQPEGAETSWNVALAQARGLGPNPQAVKDRQQEVKAGGIQALRARLKEEWKLKTDNDAQVAATGLQKNLDELAAAGQRRAEAQLQILTAAIDWGLADQVWAYIRRGTTAEDAAAADHLIFTSLPSLLAEKYRATGNQEQHELVTTAWKQLMNDRPLPRPFPVTFAESLQSDQPKDLRAAAESISQYKTEPAAASGLILQSVCRLASQRQTKKSLLFAGSISDPVLKEECYLLIAAIAGLQGESALIEKQIEEVSQATEKVALGRGLISGMTARKPNGKEASGPSGD